MGAGKNLTKDLMKKVWALCKAGHGAEEIAYFLGTSVSSVNRIKAIMTAVEKGDTHTLSTTYLDCEHIKRCAYEILEIKKQEPEEAMPKEVNEAQAVINALERLDKIATLLEKLCKALGIEEASK